MLYFPKPYPDELAGSLLIRACRHLGLPFKQMVRHLTGSRAGYFSFCLPSHLSKISLLVGMDPDELLARHTIFRYATAFMTKEQVLRHRDLILQREPSRQRCFAALTQSTTDGVPFRRYCPQCSVDDDRTSGETYWRICHNLPAVHICDLHRSPLVNTAIPLRNQGRRNYYELPNECPGTITPFEATPAVLQRVATSSQEVLSDSWSHRPDWTSKYRLLALRKGYSRRDGGIPRIHFSDDLYDHYGPALLEHAGVGFNATERTAWPALIVQERPHIPFVPVKHLLVREFLEQCLGIDHVRSDRKPGRVPRNSIKTDEMYSANVRAVLDKVYRGRRRVTLKEVLTQAGCGKWFWNDRHAYPQLSALADEFLKSELWDSRKPAARKRDSTKFRRRIFD